MDIAFKSNKLEKIFNSERELQAEYGADNAKLIKRRMGILRAASNLSQVPTQRPDRCHELEGRRKGEFAIDVKHPFRLIFKPDHDPVPKKEDGGLDMSKIVAIVIIGLEDYH